MSDDAPKLADVFVGAIDGDTLEAWIGDLGAHAELLEVSCKSGPARLADEAPRDVANAALALARGEIVAMQVRYRFEGATWCDTVLRRGDAFQLVRTELPRG